MPPWLISCHCPCPALGLSIAQPVSCPPQKAAAAAQRGAFLEAAVPEGLVILSGPYCKAKSRFCGCHPAVPQPPAAAASRLHQLSHVTPECSKKNPGVLK